MKQPTMFSIAFTMATLSLISCNNQASSGRKEEKAADTKIREENVMYTADNITMNGFVAYDESSDKKRPAVLVVHEWWGLTDYPKNRARQLAALGYIAMAVDMYGNGKTADNPDSASKWAMPFYQNPPMAKTRFDAALAKLKTYPQVDSANIAAIGYCFGGGQVLNIARLGEDLKGVVSFHGNLIGVPADKKLLKAKVLVCHGANDQYVKMEEVEKFKKQMDSIGASYILKIYPGATHAFTNPTATELGKKFNMPIAYNAAADSASWKDMKDFFNTIFK